MTRRKDPQPQTPEPETLAPEAAATESPAVTEPFVVEVETPASVEPIAASSEPGPQSPPAPQPLPPRRTGVLGPLFGGALAAIGGFALSHFNIFGLAAPETPDAVASLSAQVAEMTAAQTAATDALSGEISALSGRVATLESAPVPELPDLSRLDELEQRLAAIEAMPAGGGASTAALTAKLADLEQRLSSLPATSTDPALRQKLDDALARLSDAEAAATARAAEAEAAATAAARQKALDILSALVANGQPFATELQALADPSLTEALGTMADTGVPTLATLKAEFPDAARAALQAAREISAEDGWGDRLVDFLASQTGARSVTPREGTDPDAVLSRAEFALSEGRVADALAEIQPLDPAIKAPLDAWSAQAKTYLAATAALNAARGE
jgi:hypothetical protein